MRLEGAGLAPGEGTGDMRRSWRVPDGTDRTIVIIGERAQAIRDWETSLNDTEGNDRAQGHVLSNSERADLFAVDEDDTSSEDNSDKVKGTILDRD